MTATVSLPAILAEPGKVPDAIAVAAARAVDAALPEILTRIAQGGKVPVWRSFLQRAVVNGAVPARIIGTQVIAEINVAGEAARYAAVQDLGRRAGKPMSWKFLYYPPEGFRGPDSWRMGWVNRRRREWVVELAADLEAKDRARGTRRGAVRERRGRRANYERRAAYLIAVGVASAIRARGMPGKAFLSGERDRIMREVRTAVVDEIVYQLRGTA